MYEEVLAVVGLFSVPFIEAYNMFYLIKKSKLVSDTSGREKLSRRLEESYKSYISKKGKLPIGFKPIKTRIRAGIKKRVAEKTREAPPAVSKNESLKRYRFYVIQFLFSPSSLHLFSFWLGRPPLS
jgi:hypothetical protein